MPKLLRSGFLSGDRRTRSDTRVPGLKPLAFGIQGLADRATELEECEEQDIRQAEAVPTDELLAFHQFVQLLKKFGEFIVFYKIIHYNMLKWIGHETEIRFTFVDKPQV